MLSLRDAACSETGTGTRSDICHYLWLVLCSETGTGIRSGLNKFQLFNLLEVPFLSVPASYTPISTILLSRSTKRRRGKEKDWMRDEEEER